MDAPALRAHRNLMAFNALSAQSTPGARIEEGDGEQIVSLPHSFPFLNGVMRDHAGDDAAPLIERAKQFFASGDGPGGSAGFTVFARATEDDAALEQAADEAGLLLLLEHYPQMICERRVEEPDLPSAAEVRHVSDTEQAAAYWKVCGEAYPSLGFPLGLFEIYEPGFLLEEPVSACLGYLDGEPAAAALVAVVDGVGFIGWVATVEAARGRRLGEAVTAWVTNRAFDAGADFAALQASPMGEPIYKRMGYEQIYGYHVWMAQPQDR